MATKTEPTTEKQQKTDRSPENDLRKAVDHLRSARAKYIRGGRELTASCVLDSINAIAKLGGFAKQEEG